MIASDMKVWTLEAEGSHGINSVMGEIFLISLDNYLEEDREEEWEISFHNSLAEGREDLITEGTILDMILL